MKNTVKYAIKRLKIFGMAFTISTNSIVLLNGCSNDSYIENSDDSEEPLDITTDDYNIVTEEETTIANNDYQTEDQEEELVDEKPLNIYFEKYEEANQNYDEIIDDIILTLDEKGIVLDESQENLVDDLTYNLENSDYSNNEFEDSIISSLNVEKYFDEAFTSEVATVKVKEHADSNLYNSLEDDIYWDKLFDVVKENNAKFLQDEIDEYDELFDYQALNDEDIVIVIDSFHKFIDQIKLDYPEFDMETFACHLSDLKLCYDNGVDGSIMHTNSDGLISIRKQYDDYFIDLSKIKDLYYHEFKHFISGHCDDEHKVGAMIVDTGLYISFSPVYEYSNAYIWKFLSEATARQLENDISENPLPTYVGQCYLLDTIEMVNNFAGVEQGSILEEAIYHNPISLIQQFTIPENNTSESKKWLLENLKMISCYDLLNGYIKLWSYEMCLENKGILDVPSYEQEIGEVLDESNQKMIYTLEEYANLQLLRLGIVNLSIMNQIREEGITLDDQIYLLKLLEYRINEQNQDDSKRFNLEIGNTPYYYENYESLLTSYFYYLHCEYGIDNIGEIYQGIDLNSYVLSDAFSDLEREKYSALYQNLDINYNDTSVLSEIKESHCKKIGVN